MLYIDGCPFANLSHRLCHKGHRFLSLKWLILELVSLMVDVLAEVEDPRYQNQPQLRISVVPRATHLQQREEPQHLPLLHVWRRGCLRHFQDPTFLTHRQCLRHYFLAC